MIPPDDSTEPLKRAQARRETAPCPPAISLIELLVVLAIIGVLAGILLPVVGRAKAKAQNAVCVSNLRQLGIAGRLYAGENGERLPIAERLPTQPADPRNPLPRICDVLGRYIGQTDTTNSTAVNVFKCPMDKAGLFVTEGSSYEWNTDLNGHRVDETQTAQFQLKTRVIGHDGSRGSDTSTNVVLRFAPDTTPLLLDYREFHPRAPKPGKNVVFLDGHVAPR